MVVKLAFWMALVTLLLGGCASLASLPPLPPPAQHPTIPASIRTQANAPADTAYTIGPEDVLTITVYGHQDLSTQVVVSPDGTFTYPLLGEVQAAGLAARQLESQLATRLAEYIVQPQVSIVVTQFQSQQVHVVGEVRTPGTQMLKHASTLLEILSKAGGPTADAGWDVIVVRASEGKNSTEPRRGEVATTPSEATLQVDLEKLLAGQITQPIVVRGGDTIYVPPAAFFYVSGEVLRPGRYRLARDTTVAKALTLAGGPTRFAAQKRLKVRRVVEGQSQEFRVDLIDHLQAEDVLIVPESIF